MVEGGAVYAAMVSSGDFCEDVTPLLRSLLGEIDVFVSAGNLDPLLGAPVVAAAVDWAWRNGADRAAFEGAPRAVWRVDGDDANPAGYATCAAFGDRRFCFVVVRNSGHEAPSYAPRAAYDLSDRLVFGRAFADAPTGAADETPRCLPCAGAPPFAGPAIPGCAA